MGELTKEESSMERGGREGKGREGEGRERGGRGEGEGRERGGRVSLEQALLCGVRHSCSMLDEMFEIKRILLLNKSHSFLILQHATIDRLYT